MNDTGLPPAGWYPDAADASQTRWWDGAAWTAHTAARVSAPVAPTSRAPVALEAAPVSVASAHDGVQDAAPLTRRALRDQLGPLTVGEAEVSTVQEQARAVEALRASQPSGQVVVQPTAQRAATAVLEHPPTPDYVTGEDDAEISSAERMRRAAGYAPRAPDAEPSPAEWRTGAYHATPEPARKRSAQSLSGWLFAFSPLWVGGTSYFVRLFWSSGDALPQWIAGTVIALVLTFGLAFTDGRRLAANGYRPTSPGWVFIPIVYFILRVARVGPRSVPMLVVRIALDGLYIALVALVLGVAISQGALGSFGAGVSDGVTGSSGTSQSQGQSQNHGQAQSQTPNQSGGFVLSDGERAYDLTPQGVEEYLRYIVTSGGFVLDDIACEPFPSTEANAETTCVIQVEGVVYDLVLRVSPEYADAAFVVESTTPRGGQGNSGFEVQQS